MDARRRSACRVLLCALFIGAGATTHAENNDKHHPDDRRRPEHGGGGGGGGAPRPRDFVPSRPSYPGLSSGDHPGIDDARSGKTVPETHEAFDCKFEKSPSWADFETMAKKYATLDEFLGALKKTSPGFFTSPAYAFASQSSQAEGAKDAVTPENPRIVTADGRFVLGMIGNGKHERYEELEIFEYLPSEGRYEPRRIRFPGRPAQRKAHSVEGKGSCLRCHGNTPRPIWMSYSLWPGFYGQDAGFTPIEADARETKAFTKFRANVKGNPRYELFARDGYVYSSGSEKTNDRMVKMNYCRMGAQLTKSKLWSTYKYAIIGTLKCGSGSSFLPEETETAHAKRLGKTRAELLKDTSRITHDDTKRKAKEFEHHSPDDTREVSEFDNRDVQRVNDLRFLVEGQSLDTGIDMKSWSTNFTPGRNEFSYSFSTGGQGIRDLWRNVLAHEASRDPDFKDATECADLVRKSRAALSRR